MSRVRLIGQVITHNEAWINDVVGVTDCGVAFVHVEATIVQNACDCMACLVRLTSVRKFRRVP